MYVQQHESVQIGDVLEFSENASAHRCGWYVSNRIRLLGDQPSIGANRVWRGGRPYCPTSVEKNEFRPDWIEIHPKVGVHRERSRRIDNRRYRYITIARPRCIEVPVSKGERIAFPRPEDNTSHRIQRTASLRRGARPPHPYTLPNIL